MSTASAAAPYEPLITAREVADRLGMSVDWVLKKWQAGELPGYRLNGRNARPVRFRWSEILAWLDGQRRGPHPVEKNDA